MTKNLPFDENVVKISPVDPEVMGWEVEPLHTTFYGSLDFVRDNPGEPVPEEPLKRKYNYISRTHSCGAGMLCELNDTGYVNTPLCISEHPWAIHWTWKSLF